MANQKTTKKETKSSKGLAKDTSLEMLQKALSFEEIPNFSSINEIEEAVENAGFDAETKSAIRKRLKVLREESGEHSKLFNELIIYVLRSKKDGF